MDIRRRALLKRKASSSGGGGSTTGGSYTINLNGQWGATTAVPNPDSTLYDGVYRSVSNYNVHKGVATMYITIKDCSSFRMYIRSYAESGCDYVMVSQLDQTINGNTSYSNTTLVKAHTIYNQQSGTALSSYTLVEFTGISSGEHTITVVYRKDSSVNSGDDRGYVLIEKTQAGGGGSGGPIDINNYLTIEARENGLTASLSTNACEYCVDGNGNWKSLAIGTETESINSGQTLSFRGELTPITAGTNQGIGIFTISKKCSLKGNCMSMLFGDNAVNNYSLSDKGSAFFRLFYKCSNIVTVSSGFLPATTLSYNCYCSMFEGCTSLTTAPELPATTLGSSCYDSMFEGCTSLTTAPTILPATTLGSFCYDSMFQGCSSLTTAPVLPATTLANWCYRRMFYSCSKLNYIKMLATDISASYCLYNWVYNVASTGTFVKNPAMNSLPTGTSGIPSGWTVVNDGEESGGGSSEGAININNYLTIEARENGLTASLSTNACEYCVDGDGKWTSLAAGTATEIINSGQTLSFRGELTPALYKGIGTFTISKKCNLKGNCMSMLFGDNAANNYSLSDKNYAFYNLFNGCSNIVNVSSNFLPATTLESSCYQYMFMDCTSLTTAPELPATTLADSCYSCMFRGCTSLKTAPALPAAKLASGCYQYMFSGCTNLTTAPELPATTLAISCYDGMFRDCTSLTTAPKLPATKLASGCYRSMFEACTSLTTAPELPATTLGYMCYYNMFQNCKSLTTAPVLPATTLGSYCYYDMFYGCTNLNYIKMLATNISASNCLNNWVQGVASSGTFVKNSAMNSLPTGTSGIPSGWTVVNDGEESGGGQFYINHDGFGDGTITFTIDSPKTWNECVGLKDDTGVYEITYGEVVPGVYRFMIKSYKYSYAIESDEDDNTPIPEDLIKIGTTYYAHEL